MEDKRYPIELEVITPLSVGAGNDNDWMRGIDFVQKDGKVYVLDMRKLAEEGIDIDRLTTLFESSDEKGIGLLIGDKLDNVSKHVFTSPVSTTNAIKTFLRTQLYDKPVVAGSSIKGSVRSALFHYLREKGEKTNEEVFGNMKDGTDLMRFIRIADVEMPSTALVNTKIFNLRKEGTEWYGGWKHKGTSYDGNSNTTASYSPNGFNTLYECVVPGRKGLGSISLAAGAFELMASDAEKVISYKTKKRELLTGDIRGLFRIINQVTKTYLLKEKAFFEKYSAERSDELIENVNSLLDMIPDDDSYCIMKMSAGVGFHSITGDWRFDDYSDTGHWSDTRNAGKKMYKSRKTVEYKGQLQLMGFVKLRALDTDEASQYVHSLKAEHADIIESIVAPTRQREADRLKRIEEERLHQLAVEEDRRKIADFQELFVLANQYYNDNLWDEAIAKAEAAATIFPDRSETALMIEKCKKAKELEEYRQSEQTASTQKFSQPLADVIKGKTSAGNLIGTTAKWVKSEGNTFGKAEFHALLEEAQKLPIKEQKKLNSKRKDLEKAIGEDWTLRFFTEMGV